MSGACSNDHLENSTRRLADFDEAIYLAPKHVWSFWRRAALYVDKGDFSKALADCNEAVRLAPKMAVGLLCAGQGVRRQG